MRASVKGNPGTLLSFWFGRVIIDQPLNGLSSSLEEAFLFFECPLLGSTEESHFCHELVGSRLETLQHLNNLL